MYLLQNNKDFFYSVKFDSLYTLYEQLIYFFLFIFLFLLDLAYKNRVHYDIFRLYVTILCFNVSETIAVNSFLPCSS